MVLEGWLSLFVVRLYKDMIIQVRDVAQQRGLGGSKRINSLDDKTKQSF